jgi:hypothetical protein
MTLIAVEAETDLPAPFVGLEVEIFVVEVEAENAAENEAENDEIVETIEEDHEKQIESEQILFQ